MRHGKSDLAITGLRLVLGVDVLIQSSLLAFGPSFTHPGLPDWVPVILGWIEILAAVLFLVPRTLMIGGWSLLVCIAGAVLIHLHMGEFNVGPLLVLAVAVVVVMVHHKETRETKSSGFLARSEP
jgi:hypothetical protein